MKDFYIHMSDGKSFLFRAKSMVDVKQAIGQAYLVNNGLMEVRIPVTYKYVTINVSEITFIEEGDEF